MYVAMSNLDFVITKKNFSRYRVQRIEQGATAVDKNPMLTLLRSCVCIGFYHEESGLGGLSHITGFSHEGSHSAAGALKALEKSLRRKGIDTKDCECFLIGGADKQRQVYDNTKEELRSHGLAAKEFDVLGQAHRKLLFEPAEGKLTLFKREDVKSSLKQSDKMDRFHDPSRRVITGASTLFRNKKMLDELETTILPQILNEGPRLHVWCAGCSVGMEVYSIAMVILDWLQKKGKEARLAVLGTDVSEDALAKAQRGVYPVSDKKASSYAELLERYTEAVDNCSISMGALLRKATFFKERDIAVGSRNHKFELIVCDHVLQYFSVDIQLTMVNKLIEAMQPKGFIYVSTPTRAVRQAIMNDFGLQKIGFNLYRKR